MVAVAAVEAALTLESGSTSTGDVSEEGSESIGEKEREESWGGQKGIKKEYHADE